MLLKKDPCEGCLVVMLCEQMCPKVIKFYSNRVRIRSKHEVESATGYYWEDDYINPNTGKVFNNGGATIRIKDDKPVRFINKEPVKSKPDTLKKIINFIEKLKKGK